MKREYLNYSLHYSVWHNETTREVDIAYYKHYLRSHNFVPTHVDAKVLEIGCGVGNLMQALQQSGYTDVTGIDIDHHQTEICRAQKLNVFQADAISFLAKTKDTYDTIYLFDVLEHLDKPDQLTLLKAIFSHLSPNGKLMLSVPNALAPLAMYFEQIDWTHYCSFSPTSLSFVLKNAGFFHFTLRPSHQESLRVRKLKQPWIKLYQAEFLMNNPILTPSVIAVCFKHEADLTHYVTHTDSLMSFPHPLKYFIRRLAGGMKRRLLKKVYCKFR